MLQMLYASFIGATPYSHLEGVGVAMKLLKVCIGAALMLVVSSAVLIAEPVAQSLNKTEAQRLLRIAPRMRSITRLRPAFARSRAGTSKNAAHFDGLENVRR